MSKFLSKLKGQKQNRDDLQPDTSSTCGSNDLYKHVQSQPPAYLPPPGAPPSQSSSLKKEAGPGSTIMVEENPPPYHDWTSVPDTALFPPPPAIRNDQSSTSNASYDEAAAAHAWCAGHPVFTPTIPNIRLIETIQAGQHDLDPAPDFHGTLTKLFPSTHPSSFTPNHLGVHPSAVFCLSSIPTATQPITSKSHFLPSTTRHTSSYPNQGQIQTQDHTHLTRLPLYFATTSSPLSPNFRNPNPSPTTIYFEIRPLKFTSAESTVSIGFASKPYPPNRQPGWHRASLAVHSDDGNRYVNDAWGGQSFTSAFRAGQTLGLAMVMLPESPMGSGVATATVKKNPSDSDREVRSVLPRCKTKVFFMRDGVVKGGWDVDEERDAERDEGVAGLMGEVDLYAAVGNFGGVEVEVRFFEGGEGFCVPPGI